MNINLDDPQYDREPEEGLMDWTGRLMEALMENKLYGDDQTSKITNDETRTEGREQAGSKKEV